MNNFLGLGVVTYLTFFNYGDKAAVPEEYKNLKSWINFQVIFLYFSIAISFLMYFCFKSMQSKVVLKKENEGDKQKWNWLSQFDMLDSQRAEANSDIYLCLR